MPTEVKNIFVRNTFQIIEIQMGGKLWEIYFSGVRELSFLNG